MESYVKDLGTLIATGIGTGLMLYNWIATRRRLKLKDDLEILKKFKESFENTSETATTIDCLESKIKRRMIKQYVKQGTDKSDVIAGLLFLLAALYAGFEGESGILRWFTVTFSLSLGLILIHNGISERDVTRNNNGNEAD